MKLSEHFSLEEFTHSGYAERHSINNSATPDMIIPMCELCTAVLEPIREHFGIVHVSSGYRSPLLNEAIGGSSKSQHSKGEAADIVIYGTPAIDVCRWIEASDIPFDQLIAEGSWTHISYGSRMRRSVLTAHFHHAAPTTYVKGLTDV